VPCGDVFRSHYGPGIDSASNRNEYQEYFLGRKGGRCVGLTTLPPSCADCLEIWEPQPPGTLRACLGLYIEHLTGITQSVIAETVKTLTSQNVHFRFKNINLPCTDFCIQLLNLYMKLWTCK
jgi:hypothetical protein